MAISKKKLGQKFSPSISPSIYYFMLHLIHLHHGACILCFPDTEVFFFLIFSDQSSSHHLSARRQSGAKLHSLSVEAPITKVVNLLLAVQENSPQYIAQALDKVCHRVKNINDRTKILLK